jgi:hypothetical protein
VPEPMQLESSLGAESTQPYDQHVVFVQAALRHGSSLGVACVAGSSAKATCR